MALVMFGTKPAESQQAPTQPLYEVHDLGELPGGPFSYAFGINEAGKVVGAASVNFTPELGADEHPFLYSDGVMSDLGTLGGRNAYADDINDADKVVGSSSTNAESFKVMLSSTAARRCKTWALSRGTLRALLGLSTTKTR